MKKLIYLALLFIPFFAKSQDYVMNRIAGLDSFGYAGDGGSARDARINAFSVAVDGAGNTYFADKDNSVIRKINPAGVISTIAGTGTPGFSGDGGPAVSAAINFPSSLCIDRHNNIYFCDFMNSRVRKITPAGIISTVAGNGTTVYSGDSVSATTTAVLCVNVTVDSSGNLFIGGFHRIRKVDTTGIITTIAGTGVSGFSGDGGPAVLAEIYCQEIYADNFGNIICSEAGRIRRIDPSGIITTIAGTGTSGSTGDGGPAVLAEIEPGGLTGDANGNIFFTQSGIRKISSLGIITRLCGGGDEVCSDGLLASEVNPVYAILLANNKEGELIFTTGNTLWRMSPHPFAASSTMSSYVGKLCSGPNISVVTNSYSPSLSLKTWFGDGQVSVDAVHASYAGHGYAITSHGYAQSGTYTIKHVLFNGSAAIDSFTYSYEHLFCNEIPFQFYYDANSNCTKDAGENFMPMPTLAEVDSNGVAIDTISATSGFYYRAYGAPGDRYAFKIISAPTGSTFTCPASGILYDTIRTFVYNSVSYMGFACTGGSGSDLSVKAGIHAGRHRIGADILVGNNYCSPTDAIVTMNFSTKYNFDHSFPAPYSVSGHTATWHFPGLSMMNPQSIDVSLEVPGVWLPPGDTAQTSIIISPGTGDVDTSNNVIIRWDTVKSSYDPNEMAVTPGSNILNGTQLQYTIRFENDGNDTAQNIHVLDTLSDNVIPSTLRVVGASAAMNISTYKAGGHTIVKFDFPNIKLLDSSHYGLCDGMVIYKIKARNGLAHGTLIQNQAGIYFDDNPVVMTNQVTSTIIIPFVSISSPSGASFCPGTAVTFNATSASIKQPRYLWKKNSTIVDSATTYTTSALASGDTIICLLLNPAGDTLIAASNRLVMTVATAAYAGTLSGASAVCVGTSASVMPSVPGGIWSVSNSHATISAGIISGVSQGTVVVTYTITNSCGTAYATRTISVDVMPPGTIIGSSTVCTGLSTTMVNLVNGGAWTASNSNATVSSGGAVTGMAPGTVTISYIVANACGSGIATKNVTVYPLPVPGTIFGSSTVCASATTSLSASVSGGVWEASNSNATVTGGTVSGLVAGAVIISYTTSTACGSATSTHYMTVNPLPATAALSGAASVCEGATTALTASIPGGTWSASTGATVVSGTVTGIMPGTVIISYSVTNMCGTAASSHSMTVNPLPVSGAISGPASVCEGATITLSGTVAGGTWSTTGGGASVSAGVVTGISAGSAVISYTVTNGCGTAVSNYTVTVNPLPHAGTITGASEVCVGSSIVLTSSITGGTWSTDNTDASVSSGTVSGASAGAVNISYGVTNMCGTDYAAHAITVNPLPDAGYLTGPATVCHGETVTLTASAGSGTWSAVLGNVSVADGVVTGVVDGTDTVQYTVTNSCGTATTSSSITVEQCETGIANIAATSVVVFPNPATSSLAIRADGVEIYSCELINTLGQTVIKKDVNASHATFSIVDLVPAVYNIRIITNKGTIVRTFTKM